MMIDKRGSETLIVMYKLNYETRIYNLSNISFIDLPWTEMLTLKKSSFANSLRTYIIH